MPPSPTSRQRSELIDRELAAYGAGLDERPQVVVLNKIDLLDERPGVRSSSDPRVVSVVATSCATGAGHRRAEARALRAVPARAAPSSRRTSALPEFLEYTPRARRGPRFRILRTDRGYRVVGTPPPADELEEALRRIGIKRGAQVEVGEEELEWQ